MVKNQYKGIIFSIVLGLCLGVTGVFLMGHVAAITISKETLLWFENKELAHYTLNFISQFLAFGITGIAIGMILARISKMWLLNSVVCYAAFLLYLSVGEALIYKTEISNPFSGLTTYDLPLILLLPLCLLISTGVTARKL